MAAGKHLIIEKPMATTLAGAMKLMELADGGGISLAVDHMMVYNSYNRKAQELIAGGELGPNQRHFTAHGIPLRLHTPEEAGTWRCANPAEIGGPIGDVASHCLYMAEFLLGDLIAAIQATYTPAVNRVHVENGAFLRFRTERIRGSVRVSFADMRGRCKASFSISDMRCTETGKHCGLSAPCSSCRDTSTNRWRCDWNWTISANPDPCGSAAAKYLPAGDPLACTLHPPRSADDRRGRLPESEAGAVAARVGGKRRPGNCDRLRRS